MKLNEKNEISRLVIYFFYDKDGVVDRYVPYMLEDVKKNCSELMVVCNGKLNEAGKQSLSTIADELLLRENKGFDVWAYKTAIERYGWEKLGQYDEVAMMNFTIMGPLYPFSEMFEAMNSRELDFWGITKYHKVGFDPFGTISYGYIPEHIQSHFIAVRQNMVRSPEFQSYWNNMGPINNYNDAVGKHEAIFTKHFQDLGFNCGVYVDSDYLEGYTSYPLMHMGKELIQNRRCPIFKRKAAGMSYVDALNMSTGEITAQMIEYISSNLDYDVDMFWENILRVDNMAEIKDSMHLNYVIPRDVCVYSEGVGDLKTALVMHVYYDSEVEKCIRYADSMPLDADIFITVCAENTRQEVEAQKAKLVPRKVTVLDIPNRGRDVSSLLVGAAPYVFDYDLVCFIHDKKSKQVQPYLIGETWSTMLYENLLASRKYVANIIGRFAQEPRLGMLMPPPPHHGSYFGTMGNEWTCNYKGTVELAQELGLRVNIDADKEPITPLGTMFWFRPDSLKSLYDQNWTYEDFPPEPNGVDGTLLHAIERIYGFCVQDNGYYPAWCVHDRYASYVLTNYHFMLRGFTKAIVDSVGQPGTFYYLLITLPKIIKMSPMGFFYGGILRLKEWAKKVLPKDIQDRGRRIYHRLRRNR